MTRPAGVVAAYGGGTPYAFVIADDFSLWSNSWTGVAWSWTNHGKPPDRPPEEQFYPMGITTTSGRPIVFVITSGGMVWARSVNAAGIWSWEHLGDPPAGVLFLGMRDVVISAHGGNTLCSFALDEDTGNVWAIRRSGSEWTWTNLGHAPVGRLKTAFVSNGDWINVIQLGDDGQVWVAAWLPGPKPPRWGSFGHPGAPSAWYIGATTVDEVLDVFVIDANGHLQVNTSDGASGRRWIDLGHRLCANSPGGGATTAGVASAYAFFPGNDDDGWTLWCNRFVYPHDGIWSSIRFPPVPNPGLPAGVTTVDGQRPYFWMLFGDDLWVAWMNTEGSWAWSNQGRPH
jgi:hypothetical protein